MCAGKGPINDYVLYSPFSWECCAAYYLLDNFLKDFYDVYLFIYF